MKQITEAYPTIPNFYEGKSVLILGGMGFIGSNTAHQLVKMRAHVTILDAMLPLYGGNPANIAQIEDKVKVVKGDIRDFDLISKEVQGKDVVVDYAAQTSHVHSMQDPLLDVDINCRGTINVLEAVRRFNPKARVVIAGTRSQVGRMEYNPIDEKHPEFPTDIYSANKTAGEKYALIYSWSHNIFATSLRITNVYGPRAQVKNPGYGVVNYFIRLAIEGKSIDIYEPGLQTRDYLFVDDVVSAMLLSATDEKANGQVFNVASGKTIPVKDIIEKIVSLAGTGTWKLTPWPDNRKRIEVGDVSMSIEKIGKVLGWVPLVDLDNGLTATIQFYRDSISSYI